MARKPVSKSKPKSKGKSKPRTNPNVLVKPIGKAPGQMQLKKLSGATINGEYVKQRVINRPNNEVVIEQPYRLGSNVVWLSDAHLGRVKEEVEARNRAARIAYDEGVFRAKKRVVVEVNGNRKVELKTTVITPSENKSFKEARREASKKAVEQSKRYREKVVSKQSYTQATAAFLAKFTEVADSMSLYLQNKDMFSKEALQELQTLARKIANMTEEQRLKFYEENYQLFADWSDYYQWLKRHSGRPTATDRASNRYQGMSVESYMQKNLESMRKLNRKIDDYV